MGQSMANRSGNPLLPLSTIELVLRVWLVGICLQAAAERNIGILHTPVEHRSFNVGFRQELDIYASIVMIKNIAGHKTRHDHVDLCIIRENTEWEYSGLEH